MREESGFGQRGYANNEGERCERCEMDDQGTLCRMGETGNLKAFYLHIFTVADPYWRQVSSYFLTKFLDARGQLD